MSDIATNADSSVITSNPDDPNATSETRPALTYVVIGTVIVVLAVLIFYAYTSFTAPTEDEPNDKPPPDETITDFNLRDAIQRIQTIQARVMNSLSDVSNI